MTHAWNEQVLLIIHRSLVSSLAHCSHTAGDQQCNPGCSKIHDKQQTAPGGPGGQATLQLEFAWVKNSGNATH